MTEDHHTLVFLPVPYQTATLSNHGLPTRNSNEFVTGVNIKQSTDKD
jgi:hypothetical protein